MIYLLVALVGACLGILDAAARVPQSRTVPAAAIVLLIATATIAMIVLRPDLLFAGVVLLASLLVGDHVYGAILWKRVPPHEESSLGELIWQDATGYARRSYRAWRGGSSEEADEEGGSGMP